MAALGSARLIRPARGWLIGLAGLWLVAVVLAASPAGASHPPVTLEIGPLEPDAALPDPALHESLPPVTPGTAALVCLAVLVLPGILAARRWQRAATLAMLGMLVWFSAEAAFHSAHHLTDPEGAEHCSVFSAAQHLSGIHPEPAMPVLERPVPTAAAPLPPPAAPAGVALDGEQARAPPARPA